MIRQYLADYGWLTWILIGLLAGAIAKAITPGRDPSGCLVTILLGIAGRAGRRLPRPAARLVRARRRRRLPRRDRRRGAAAVRLPADRQTLNGRFSLGAALAPA